MNRIFAAMVEQNIPKFNPDILNGLACHYVPLAQEWLDGVFRSASKSFPPGLTYEGCERCTPHEEYLEATKLRNGKRNFDLAESDLFLIRLKFNFQDENGVVEQVPDRYLYLPFVNEAGLFQISGTTYHVTGVLSDRVISPGISNVFVRLLRDRLRFFHVGHSVMIDNRRETFNVVWSGIYRKNPKDRSSLPTTRCYSAVAHYLFARHGFTETFNKYANFVPKVVEYSPEYVKTPGTVLCRSSYFGSKIKPSTYIGNIYSASNLCLEIPQEHWNQSTAALVSGFFYIIDHFPDRFTIDRLDSKFLWSVILGHVIFSGLSSEARLYERIHDHFLSLDDYLDILIKNKLKDIGWELEDFYDLIAMIMIKFPDLLHGGQIDVNSMYTKNIEILQYMLFDIASKIFKVIYYLRKPKTRKPLTLNIVKEAFNKNMTPRTIFKITKNAMIVEPVSYCGDNKFAKLTSKITEQEAGSSKFKKKPKRVQLSESNHINSSMIECGNVLFLSKSNPMPNSHLNPYVKVNLQTGAFIPNPELAPKLNELQNLLTRITGVDPDEVEDGLLEEELKDLLETETTDEEEEESDEVEGFETDDDAEDE